MEVLSHFTGEETESERGHGAVMQVESSASLRRACQTRDGPCCSLPRPGVQGQRAGPYLQQHPRAAPGPLSPLSDLTATGPESQHVRWVTRCRFRREPVMKGVRNAELTPPSCKASSCVR